MYRVCNKGGLAYRIYDSDFLIVTHDITLQRSGPWLIITQNSFVNTLTFGFSKYPLV